MHVLRKTHAKAPARPPPWCLLRVACRLAVAGIHTTTNAFTPYTCYKYIFHRWKKAFKAFARAARTANNFMHVRHGPGIDQARAKRVQRTD